MIYCDTSLFVSLLTTEGGTAESADWFAQNAAGGLMASDWTGVEIASALAMKHRRGAIDGLARHRAWQAWLNLIDNSLVYVGLDAQDLRLAATLVDAGSGLRAGDALHLAVALGRRVALATRDRDLAVATRANGVAIHYLAATAT